MLIEFNVGNFRSFKKKVTFSMLAIKKDNSLEDKNIFEYKSSIEEGGSKLKLNLLKTAAIYGANASGKSNLLKAMNCMRTKVIGDQIKEPISPFKLDENTLKEPSYFEIIFIKNKRKYRYGFEADDKKIYKEWLYYTIIKEINLYSRELDSKIKINNNETALGNLLNKIDDNILFLTMGKYIKNDKIADAYDWFENFIIIDNSALPTLNVDTPMQVRLFNTISHMTDQEYKNKVLRYTKESDFMFNDFEIEESNKDFMPKSISPYTKYGKFRLGFLSDESNGTKVFISFIGEFMNITEKPRVFIVDELENSLHPYLLRLILDLFNSNDNPYNAQLIFTAHNTNLLDEQTVRKDQIWFCERNKEGVSDIFSLCEFKVPKKRIKNLKSYEKNYLLGKYGAVPIINKIIK